MIKSKLSDVSRLLEAERNAAITHKILTGTVNMSPNKSKTNSPND